MKVGEWRKCELGDVIELKRGYDLPSRLRTGGEFPLISSSGRSDTHDQSKVSGPGVVTGRYGTIGQVFYIEEDFWPLNTTLYVRDFKGNNPRFIYYFLQGLNWESFNDKSGVPGVNRNDVHRAIVSIADQDTQKAIVGVLSSIDDKIELNRRTNETLEAMAQAIFRDWFVDFGPVHRKMQGETDPTAILGGLIERSAKAAALAALFPDTLDDNELPQAWKFVPLDSLAVVTMGNSPAGSTYNGEGIGVPLVNGPVEYGDFFLRKVKWTTAPNKLAKRGDLIVCVRGSTTGRHAFADAEYCLGRGVASIRGREDDQEYVETAMLQSMDRLLEKTTGSVFPSLSSGDIKDFDLIDPGKNLIQAFVELVRPMKRKTWHSVKEVSELVETRDYLLPKLMSGEIRSGTFC